MRGCLLLIFGFIVGALGVLAVQALVLTPGPLLPPPSANGDVQILLRNQYLTRLFQAEGSQVPVLKSFRGLTVQTQPGQGLVLSGTLSQGGLLAIPTRVVLRPSVNQNQLRIDVVQADVGTLAIPGSAFTGLADPINQELAQSFSSQTYRIVGVTTTSDGLVIEVATS